MYLQQTFYYFSVSFCLTVLKSYDIMIELNNIYILAKTQALFQWKYRLSFILYGELFSSNGLCVFRVYSRSRTPFSILHLTYWNFYDMIIRLNNLYL